MYVSSENNIRKQQSKELLLRPKNITVTGIKTEQNVKEILKDVEKIKSLTLRFHPLNGEWDCDPMFDAVDSVRKKLNSNTGKIVLNSPGNINEVAKFIEKSAGMVETQMQVRYNSDCSLSGTKKEALIKDSQISENINIDIEGELKNAYDEVYAIKDDIPMLNVESRNNIIYYEEFLRKRNHE